MSKMVQIRNVPEDLHRNLKSRAAMAGMSLSDYLLAELRRVAERPTREDLLERLRNRQEVSLSSSVSEVLAEERQSR
jgi:plasmid stability protein